MSAATLSFINPDITVLDAFLRLGLCSNLYIAEEGNVVSILRNVSGDSVGLVSQKSFEIAKLRLREAYQLIGFSMQRED